MSYILLPPQGSPYWGDPVTTYAELPTTDPLYTVREVTSEGALYYWDGVTWNLVGGGLTPSGISDTDSVDLTVTVGVLSADVRLSSDAADAGYILGELAIRTGASKGLRAQIANTLIRGLISGANLISYNSATGVIDLTASTIRSLLSGTNLISYNNTTGVIDLTSATIWALFSGTSPIIYNNATGAISIQVATSLQDGYLSSTDWVTFNSKEPALAPGTTSDYYRGDKTWQTLNIAALQSITNGSSASAGQLNELMTGTQAANTSAGVGSTGAFGAVTSVTVTAGRWRLNGVAGFHENGAVLTTALQCGICDSATGVGISEFNTSIHSYLLSSTSDALFPTPTVYVSISTPTTYYLNTRFYYTSGSPQHRGQIIAERIG